MIEKNYLAQEMTRGALMGAQRIDENPTVEENIDRKISFLQGEIDRLLKSKNDLGPLLNMRIRDIRLAMEY